MNHIHYFVKTILGSLILLIIFIPLHTAAFVAKHDGKYKTALCNSCNDMEMQAAAVSAIPSGGNVHVIDFNKNKLKAFNVQSKLGLVNIVENSVSKEVNEAVAELRESVQFMKSVAAREVPLSDIQPYMPSSTIIGSAHSLKNSGAQRYAVANALAEYLMSSSSLKASSDVLGLGLVSSSVPVNHVYTIKFADGTSYEFIFKNLKVNVITGDVNVKVVADNGT